MSEYAPALSDAEVRRYTIMAEGARASEAEPWEQAGIGPGATIGAIGCGPAAVSVCMARLVAPSGRVVAVEADDVALVAARGLVNEAGVDNVKLRRVSATATGLPPGSLDAAVVRHVSAHNGTDEQRVVHHLAELARPGGRGSVPLTWTPWSTSKRMGR